MTEVTPLPKQRRRKRRTALDRGELKNARLELIRRSEGRCEARGFSPSCTGIGEHMHHKLRRAQGGANDQTNLLWACAPCHESIHASPAEAYRVGLMLRASE